MGDTFVTENRLMALTHSVSTAYRTNAGTIINITETLTGVREGSIDAVVSPNATQEFDVAIGLAVLQSLMICSDQPGVLQTNDQNTPQDVINLRANIPIVWTINSHWVSPFRADVAKIFLTNNGAVEANIKLRMLSN